MIIILIIIILIIFNNARCCYYSLYVILGTGLVSGTATAAHFLVGRQEGYGEFKVIRTHNLDLRDSHEYLENSVCYDFTLPTYLETICVHSDVAQI